MNASITVVIFYSSLVLQRYYCSKIMREGERKTHTQNPKNHQCYKCRNVWNVSEKNGWNHDFINHQSGGDCEINCDDSKKKNVYLFSTEKKDQRNIKEYFRQCQRHELNSNLVNWFVASLIKLLTWCGMKRDFSPFIFLSSFLYHILFWIFFIFFICVGLNIYQLIIICDIFCEWRAILRTNEYRKRKFFAIYVWTKERKNIFCLYLFYLIFLREWEDIFCVFSFTVLCCCYSSSLFCPSSMAMKRVWHVSWECNLMLCYVESKKRVNRFRKESEIN